MSLFNNYKSTLEDVLGKKKPDLIKGFNTPHNILNLNERYYSESSLSVQQKSQSILSVDSSQLNKYFGANKHSFDTISIGNHPDFEAFLDQNQTANHYCVSMFVDIKGSTKLALNYSLEEVRLIKDTLLTLCINIICHFGGHVHRLQGDAVFAQFVRFDKNPNDSIINSINASSVLCQTVSEDLASAFTNYGLDPLKIRVGIDYGNNDQVMWSHYGIANCSELTTTSLHTDLAAKLQNKASENSVRIGKNLIDAVQIKDKFVKIPVVTRNRDQVEDRYIISTPNFTYRQYDFDWKRYLNSFSFYKKNSVGKLELIDKSITLIASIYPENQPSKVTSYPENNHSILKGHLIKYQLIQNGIPYHKKSYETIEWEAYNDGPEAIEAKEQNHDFEGKYRNKTFCIAHAGYHGNHYLKCTIKRDNSDNEVLKFPIYVDNKKLNSSE